MARKKICASNIRKSHALQQNKDGVHLIFTWTKAVKRGKVKVNTSLLRLFSHLTVKQFDIHCWPIGLWHKFYYVATLT